MVRRRKRLSVSAAQPPLHWPGSWNQVREAPTCADAVMKRFHSRRRRDSQRDRIGICAISRKIARQVIVTSAYSFGLSRTELLQIFLHTCARSHRQRHMERSTFGTVWKEWAQWLGDLPLVPIMLRSTANVYAARAVSTILDERSISRHSPKRDAPFPTGMCPSEIARQPLRVLRYSSRKSSQRP